MVGIAIYIYINTYIYITSCDPHPSSHQNNYIVLGVENPSLNNLLSLLVARKGITSNNFEIYNIYIYMGVNPKISLRPTLGRTPVLHDCDQYPLPIWMVPKIMVPQNGW